MLTNAGNKNAEKEAQKEPLCQKLQKPEDFRLQHFLLRLAEVKFKNMICRTNEKRHAKIVRLAEYTD